MAVLLTRAGWHSETGRRPTNQDAVLAEQLPDGRELFAVADGMGGHRAGEVASQRALETLSAGLKAGAALRTAVADANATVYAAAQENADWLGMGTTLVALLRSGVCYQIVNVGDSRAYRVTTRGVQQITADHSFMAEAVSNGRMSLEEARRSRWRNALTRAIGTDTELAIDVYGPFDAVKSHAVLLCSDGLYGSVADDVLHGCVIDTPDPQAAAARLSEEAYRNGSSDNISVVIVRFGAFHGIG